MGNVCEQRCWCGQTTVNETRTGSMSASSRPIARAVDASCETIGRSWVSTSRLSPLLEYALNRTAETGQVARLAATADIALHCVGGVYVHSSLSRVDPLSTRIALTSSSSNDNRPSPSAAQPRNSCGTRARCPPALAWVSTYLLHTYPCPVRRREAAAHPGFLRGPRDRAPRILQNLRTSTSVRWA
jgi:hypothetical protein